MAKSYTLYTYYGSTCSQRIRIALALKEIKPEHKFIHLLKEEHHAAEYIEVNPSHSVPTLVVTEHDQTVTITQSLAIMEYLEETVSEGYHLLPPTSDPVARAKVRTLADIIACDVQPVTNLRIVKVIKPAGIDVDTWQTRFMNAGFEAYERVASDCAGRYSFGDSVSMADCALLPAVHRAKRFNVDFKPYPTISRIVENLEKQEAFSQSHWLRQPDTPSDMRL